MTIRICLQLSNEDLIVCLVSQVGTQVSPNNNWMTSFDLNTQCVVIPSILKVVVEIHMFKKWQRTGRMNTMRANKRLQNGVLLTKRRKRSSKLACSNRQQ